MVVYFVQGALGLAALARTYFLKEQLGLAPAVVAATIASLGVAMSDVVVDSLVVEQAREDKTASSGSLQSLCWTCQSSGGLASAYLSGSLLETMRPQQVFGITALLPLLVALIALQLDEKPIVRREGDAGSDGGGGGGGGALQEFVGNTRAQGGLLWETVAQRQVWLPALFIFLWQATPSCGDAFFYFITDDLGIGPEFLGRVKVGTSLASIFGIWCYRTFLQQVPIKQTLKWTAIASAVLGLSQLLLVTHVNRDLGI